MKTTRIIIALTCFFKFAGCASLPAVEEIFSTPIFDEESNIQATKTIQSPPKKNLRAQADDVFNEKDWVEPNDKAEKTIQKPRRMTPSARLMKSYDRSRKEFAGFFEKDIAELRKGIAGENEFIKFGLGDDFKAWETQISQAEEGILKLQGIEPDEKILEKKITDKQRKLDYFGALDNREDEYRNDFKNRIIAQEDIIGGQISKLKYYKASLLRNLARAWGWIVECNTDKFEEIKICSSTFWVSYDISGSPNDDAVVRVTLKETGEVILYFGRSIPLASNKVKIDKNETVEYVGQSLQGEKAKTVLGQMLTGKTGKAEFKDNHHSENTMFNFDLEGFNKSFAKILSEIKVDPLGPKPADDSI